MKARALLGVLSVIVACGCSSGAVGGAPLPSPFPTVSASGSTPPPPASAKCTLPIPAGDQLALVSLENTSSIVVRDITELSNAATLCVVDGASFVRFVDATDISYIVTAPSGQGALYLFDLQNNTTSLVRAWSAPGSINEVYAWSPDGKLLTYLSSD
ncbi:MAG TPA: hypothetical protein VNU19_18160, partial [Candidatus Acidoferrum sp.]|nr:hypothetical protein [Candidatus Acidoferrum sp.]